jgi:hypothetical protein
VSLGLYQNDDGDGVAVVTFAHQVIVPNPLPVPSQKELPEQHLAVAWVAEAETAVDGMTEFVPPPVEAAESGGAGPERAMSDRAGDEAGDGAVPSEKEESGQGDGARNVTDGEDEGEFEQPLDAGHGAATTGELREGDGERESGASEDGPGAVEELTDGAEAPEEPADDAEAPEEPTDDAEAPEELTDGAEAPEEPEDNAEAPEELADGAGEEESGPDGEDAGADESEPAPSEHGFDSAGNTEEDASAEEPASDEFDENPA